jgi:hypothetical protein
METMVLDIGVIASSLADRTRKQHGVDLPARFPSVVELVRAGEPKVALEVLLTNVDEFDVPLATAEFACLANEGRDLGLRATEWGAVARLVAES